MTITAASFDVDIDGDGYNPAAGTLNVNVTDEGIICDVIDSDGTVIATWGATAQELADNLCY